MEKCLILRCHWKSFAGNCSITSCVCWVVHDTQSYRQCSLNVIIPKKTIQVWHWKHNAVLSSSLYIPKPCIYNYSSWLSTFCGINLFLCSFHSQKSWGIIITLVHCRWNKYSPEWFLFNNTFSGVCLNKYQFKTAVDSRNIH